MIYWKHSSFCTFSSSVFFLFNLAFIVIYLLKTNFSWTQWKFTVVVLLACLFCSCKIEKNKDEGEAKTFMFNVCYVMSIFVLHQGDETQQTMMAENCVFMRHQVFWNLKATLKYWGRNTNHHTTHSLFTWFCSPLYSFLLVVTKWILEPHFSISCKPICIQPSASQIET